MTRSVNAPFLRAPPLSFERVAPSPHVPSANDAAAGERVPADSAHRGKSSKARHAHARRAREG